MATDEHGAGAEWREEERVAAFVARETPHRAEAEAALLELVPAGAPLRVLDLGTGDGRLLRVLAGHAPLACAVGTDVSPEMLRRARAAAADASWELVEHDLQEPLPVAGPFDVVVSGLAIHHLEHDRQRSLYAEVRALLAPGGVFANLDLVQSRTARLDRDFLAAIGRDDGGDPSDRPAPVEEHVRWLDAAGFADADCLWRWRGLAVLAGRA